MRGTGASRGRRILQQAPHARPPRRRPGGRKADDPGSRGAGGNLDSGQRRTWGHLPAPPPPGLETIKGRPRPGGEKHIPGPSPSWGEKRPRDSESTKAQIIQGPKPSEARSARGRSVQGREPSDKSRHHTPSQPEEAQGEIQDPVHCSNPTEPGGTIGSIRMEPLGKGMGATQPVEDTQ